MEKYLNGINMNNETMKDDKLFMYKKARSSKTFVTLFYCFLGVLLFGGIAVANTVITNTVVDSPTGTYTNISADRINEVLYVDDGNATDLDLKLRNLNDNDTLIIPKGYYEITNCSQTLGLWTISADSVTIKGQGHGSYIHINCNIEEPTGKQVFRITGDNFLMKDLYLQGNQTDEITQNQYNKTPVMILLTSSHNSMLSNLWFLDGAEAIDISSSKNIEISDITVFNTEHPLNIQGSSENININNFIAKQYARDGRSGYLQTGMKIQSPAKNIIVNNFNLIGYEREAFRISGGRNLVFNNIYLEGNGNYSINTPTLAGFNILNSSNIVINNLESVNGKEDITIDNNNNNFDNLIISNMMLINTTSGFSIPSSPFNVSNVKISDSIILISNATGSSGIDIRTNNLTNVDFINVQIYPTDKDNTNGKAVRIPVDNLKGLSFINSRFNGPGGDIDIATFINAKIRIINSQFLDNDIRGKAFTNTTAWNFTEFRGNYYGTDDNPTYYEHTIGGNLTIAQKITFALAETIDNLIDGWLRITGSLEVTGDLNVTGTVTSANINGVLYVEAGNGSDINQTISECPEDKCTVMIPCGTYNIANEIIVRSNLTIQGFGECTILNKTSTNGKFRQNEVLENLIIKDLRFDGNNIQGIAINLDGGYKRNIRIYGLNINNHNTTAIRINGTVIDIHDNLIENVSNGIVIVKNEADDISLNGEIRINNNRITSNYNSSDANEYGEGIEINTHSYGRAIITGNEIVGFREQGIDASIEYAIISNNYIEMVSNEGRISEGIFLTTDSSKDNSGIISSNIIINIPAHSNGRGIRISGTKGVSIIGNILQGTNNTDGIGITLAASNYTSLVGNSFTTIGRGIQFFDESDKETSYWSANNYNNVTTFGTSSYRIGQETLFLGNKETNVDTTLKFWNIGKSGYDSIILDKGSFPGSTGDGFMITNDVFINNTLMVNETLYIGNGNSQVNITMTAPNGNEGCCGMDNSYVFSCTAGACN